MGPTDSELLDLRLSLCIVGKRKDLFCSHEPQGTTYKEQNRNDNGSDYAICRWFGVYCRFLPACSALRLVPGGRMLMALSFQDARGGDVFSLR